MNDERNTEEEDETYAVKSVKTSHDIVKLLKRNRGFTLSEVAEELNVTKGAVHQHLETLQKLGYVVNRDGEYHLGLKYLMLGDTARKRHPLYDIAKNELRKLAKTSGETAVLMMVERGQGIYIFHSTGGGKEAPHEIHLGEPQPLTDSTPGRAVLSVLPEEKRRTYLTNEEWERLLPEITEINDRALIISHDEDAGLNTVARAVVDSTGMPVAAVSVVGDVDDLRGRLLSEDVVGMLVNTVQSIERKFDRNNK